MEAALDPVKWRYLVTDVVIARLYTDEAGESHFGTWEWPATEAQFAPPAAPVEVTEPGAAAPVDGGGRGHGGDHGQRRRDAPVHSGRRDPVGGHERPRPQLPRG